MTPLVERLQRLALHEAAQIVEMYPVLVQRLRAAERRVREEQIRRAQAPGT